MVNVHTCGFQFEGDWFAAARLTTYDGSVSAGRVHVQKIDDDTFRVQYRAAV